MCAIVAARNVPYKMVKNNKSPECVQYYMHIFFLRPVYYDNRRFHLKNNNKKGAFV